MIIVLLCWILATLLMLRFLRFTKMNEWEDLNAEGFEQIKGKECVITLEPRPHYCDRGNWIAKLFPVGRLALEIDAADAWPRYYFDKDRAKLEIEAWLTKRKQAK